LEGRPSGKVSDAKGGARVRTTAMINAQMVEVEALRDRRTYQPVEGEF